MEATCRSIDACVGCWLVGAVLMWCQVSVTDLRSRATLAVCPKRNHSFHWVRNMLFTRVVGLERASLLAWESRAGRRRPTPNSDIEQLFPEGSQDSRARSQGRRSTILLARLMMSWSRIFVLLLLMWASAPAAAVVGLHSEATSDVDDIRIIIR